jgi:Ca2+-binding RTX toxin-like protein
LSPEFSIQQPFFIEKNMQDFKGTDSNDTLIGGSGNDSLYGLGEDDRTMTDPQKIA